MFVKKYFKVFILCTNNSIWNISFESIYFSFIRWMHLLFILANKHWQECIQKTTKIGIKVIIQWSCLYFWVIFSVWRLFIVCIKYFQIWIMKYNFFSLLRCLKKLMLHELFEKLNYKHLGHIESCFLPAWYKSSFLSFNKYSI